ncbi:MAG: NTPase [Chloroflexota bacterium]|nr:NTPase [Chloroflexota bacterium]
MNRVCFLTGSPGVGKTTLIKKAIATVGFKAGGFYTQEIREHGTRLGFEIITLDGQRVILAHMGFASPYRVGKYGVDIQNLNNVGVAALRKAIEDSDVVVVDEVGKMELFSDAFRSAVLEAAASGKKVIGTIMLASHPWADEIKRTPNITVLNLTKTNNAQVLQNILKWLN